MTAQESYNRMYGQPGKGPSPFGVIMIILIFILICCLFSCSSSKDIQQQRVEYDSSWTKSVLDSNRVLKQEKERLESVINEMVFAGVHFDTVFVAGRTDTVVNTVTITKDGDIKASGNISSAFVSKNVLTKIVNEKQSSIDSLTKALTEEKKNIKTVTETKQVEKKVRVMTGLAWWLIVVAFIGGLYLGVKYSSKIKQQV